MIRMGAFDQLNQNRYGDRVAPVPLPEELWPGRVVLSAIIRKSRVRWTSTGQYLHHDTTALTPGVSVLKDWHLYDPELMGTSKDWVYSGAQCLTYANDDIQFFWAPVISAAAELVPVRTSYRVVEREWPIVLDDLNLVLDIQFAGAGDKNNTVNPRMFEIPGDSYPTKIRTDVYVSNTEWTDDDTDPDFAIPMPIRSEFYGAPFYIPPCLHGDITIPSLASTEAQTIDCIPNRRGERIAQLRQLAATNQTSWTEQLFSIQTKVESGIHFMITETAIPPARPRIVVK